MNRKQRRTQEKLNRKIKTVKKIKLSDIKTPKTVENSTGQTSFTLVPNPNSYL